LAKRLQEQFLECELERDSICLTWANVPRRARNAVLKERGQKMHQAQPSARKKSQHGDTSPICWQPRPGSPAATHELGEPTKARRGFTQILPAGPRPPRQAAGALFPLAGAGRSPGRAGSGRKKARCRPHPRGRQSLVARLPAYATATKRRGFRYLLATTYLGETKTPKMAPEQKREYLDTAKRFCSRPSRPPRTNSPDRARDSRLPSSKEEGG